MKKMNIKSVIRKAAAFGVSALLIGSMAACGGSGSSGSNSGTAAETKAAESSASGNASASDANWPDSTVTIVVPASAGGGTDLIARVMAEKLTNKLGQTFIVQNVTGAGGSSGTSTVLDSDPDGNTILFFHNAMAINTISGVTDYSYEDFVAGPHVVTDGATGFYVSADAPYQTYPELIDYCKAHPGEVTMGVETGGFTWLMVKSFEAATGVTFNMVDVGSNADKCTALLGGHIDIMPNQYSTAKGYIDSGDFTCLGFPTEERSSVYPDVPTAVEQGLDWVYNGYEFGFWFPKDTDQSIADTLSNTVQEMFDNNEIQEDILALGNDPVFMNGADYAKLMGSLQAQYAELWNQSNQ